MPRGHGIVIQSKLPCEIKHSCTYLDLTRVFPTFATGPHPNPHTPPPACGMPSQFASLSRSLTHHVPLSWCKFVWIMYFDCTLSFMDSNNFFINELQTFHKRTNTPPKKLRTLHTFGIHKKQSNPPWISVAKQPLAFAFWTLKLSII